jgi:hypothetical protein
MSRGDAAPVATIASATRRPARRARASQNRDLDLGRLLAANGTSRLEGLDALATGLDLLGQDGRDVVVGVRSPIALLGVVDGVLGHPQGVAAQRVTGPHGGGHIGAEPISERHR